MAFDGFLFEDNLAAPRAVEPGLCREARVLVHDLNNLVGVILSASELLGERFAPGSQELEIARMSQDAAEQAAELLRRLADAARAAPEAASPARAEGPKTAVVDCAEVAAATARLARVSAPRSVLVEAEAAAEPLRCAADRTGLESALLNLCVNARHAMPQGGAMVVSAKAADLAGDDADALELAPGAYVALSVADTGVGMAPDVLARATEPYFTTREGRGGTGLGLAGVRDYVMRAGGGLALTSQQGRGTTVTLYLPRV